MTELRTNERTNIQTDERKDENYIPVGINAGGITRQNLSNSDDLFIIIDDDDISNVDNRKLLGIIIDKTLSWDKQIDSVCLNITRRITLLKLLS